MWPFHDSDLSAAVPYHHVAYLRGIALLDMGTHEKRAGANLRLPLLRLGSR